MTRARRGAIDEHDRPERGNGVRDEQPETRERGDAVAKSSDLLVLARAVAKKTTRDPHERRCPLLEPVRDPELQRRETEGVDGVERQDRRDHLRGDVREQADQPEQDDVAGDADVSKSQ
jgi:hypothetical protein